MGSILRYIAIVILVIFSAFFSGSEIAYASANEKRLKASAETKKGLSRRWAYYIKQNYDKALSTILIGNNLVNIASSSIATLIVINLLGDNYAWVATVVMTLIVLTFGEILPKVVASGIAEGFSTFVAIPLRLLMVITYPLVMLVMWMLHGISKLWSKSLPDGPSVTEDDIENFIETAEDEGILDEERSDLLQSALDFDDVLAYEIITHRVDMISIDIDDPYEDILRTINTSPYTRIPVYEDTIDNIIGILHLNHALKLMIDSKHIDIRKEMMPVNFVHKTTPLPDVLAVMKQKQCHMVVVTDEYGGTMGIITMEDVLEQLVGDIWDESDEIVDELVKLDDTTYEADGDMRIYDFLDEMELDDRDFDDDNATLGGWAIEMLGGYPAVGDSFEYEHLTITVKKLGKRRIERLLIHVGERVEPEDDDI